MYYVMFGFWGELWGEYETYEEAYRVCSRLEDRGEEAWITWD